MKKDMPMQAPQTLVWIAENIALGKKDIESKRKLLAQAEKDEDRKPMAKDGTDWHAITRNRREALDAAIAEHFKWLSKQQLFDKTVDEDKRDGSEQISRDEGARCFSMFAIYMRTATESLLTRIIPEIRESKSPEDAYAMMQQSFNECFSHALDSAVREAHLPLWAKEAVEAVL